MRLAAKVAVITGAGSGLGRESAKLFAREGASVVVTDVDESRAKETVAQIHDAGGTASPLKADVTVENDIAHAVAHAVGTYGRLDIMFANAGIPSKDFGITPFDEVTEQQWNEVHDVVLRGVFFAVKHAVKAMKNTGGGSIVCTSSAASMVGYPGFPQYGAAKGGINAFVRALAAWELGQFGIRINAICPTHGMSVNFLLPAGAPVVGKSYEEAAEDWNPADSPIPLKLPRPPSLLDNAYPALFLASDESMYMSGVCIPTCDGGTLSRVSIPFGDNWQGNLRDSVSAYLGGRKVDVGGA